MGLVRDVRPDIRQLSNAVGKEWDKCLQEVMDLQEDLENPYDCMARYELRLGKRGIKTVLGMVCDEYKASASKVGMALELVPDAIMLLDVMRKAEGKH